MVRAPPVLLVPTGIIYIYLISMIIAAAVPEIRLMKRPSFRPFYFDLNSSDLSAALQI